MGEKGIFIDSIFLLDFYATHTGSNTNTNQKVRINPLITRL